MRTVIQIRRQLSRCFDAGAPSAADDDTFRAHDSGVERIQRSQRVQVRTVQAKQIAMRRAPRCHDESVIRQRLDLGLLDLLFLTLLCHRDNRLSHLTPALVDLARPLRRRRSDRFDRHGPRAGIHRHALALDNAEVVRSVSVEGWFDRYKQVLVGYEIWTDDRSRCADVPVHVCTRTDDDQPVRWCGFSDAEMVDSVVEEGMSYCQARVRSTEDYDVEWLCSEAGWDFGDAIG